MLLSKANLYNEADQKVSFFAGALTHPARLRILRTLRDEGPKTVFDISLEHPLSLPAVSQHLEILRERKVIDFKPQYPYLIYSLNEEVYEEARKSLAGFFIQDL